LLPEQFHIAEAKWRASTVDELSRKVQAGDMNIKDYVRAVSQLKFFPGETEAPSDMPVADPFADELEISHGGKETGARRGKSTDQGGSTGQNKDLDEFFNATAKRAEETGLFDKVI
jgi:hypothetical protein